MMAWSFRIPCIAAALTLCASSVGARVPWPNPAPSWGTPERPEIVLTFDDGPHEVYTPIILDELEKRGLQALFFWVGHRTLRPPKRIDARMKIIRRAVKAGHIIGNHTVNHSHLCSLSKEEAAKEIDDAKARYVELTGLPILHFRAPYGDRCAKLEELLAERQLHHLHWDMDPREWLYQSKDHTAEYVIGKLKRLQGRSVILMHDTKKATAAALPMILDWIDEENARRSDAGLPAIVIVPPAALVAEQMDSGALLLVSSQSGAAVERVNKALSHLIPGMRVSLLSRR